MYVIIIMIIMIITKYKFILLRKSLLHLLNFETHSRLPWHGKFRLFPEPHTNSEEVERNSLVRFFDNFINYLSIVVEQVLK